jgi:hypothetical protein
MPNQQKNNAAPDKATRNPVIIAVLDNFYNLLHQSQK